MSLVWTIIASFLYLEIAIVLILALPIFSAIRWQRFFKSRFFAVIENQVHVYFYILLAVLVMFLLDSIREMRKYSHPDPELEMHLNAGNQHNMRMFRAQRNFYISGFAIFLIIVIRRLISLITNQAEILQARVIAYGPGGPGPLKQDASSLQQKYIKLEAELKAEKEEKKLLLEKTKSVEKDYDILAKENVELQKKLKVLSNEEPTDKKED